VRFPQIAVVSIFVALVAFPLFAQSPNATINGLVLDPSNNVIVGADILVINDETGVTYSSKTNSNGIYVAPNLPPGPYRIQVGKAGFKTLIKPDIVLNVQDALSINFTLPVGAVFETVTVEGGAPLVNTTDASVSTVVERQYVENMPLNGRSFQDLILLTPGVVTNNPQNQAGVNNSGGGEFSVNGQRTESNYYTVDGVSANIAINPSSAATPGATSGSLPASTVLGTTQALVSIDALEEFRIQSSTYSAEYGRNPGGQFSFVTRSGTNLWHGTAFDYLRNSVFDSNDWFNNYYAETKPPERQNDFGGTLGGSIEIPGIYNGKDRTFFFLSYEGLRLAQPQAATVSYVPDASLRLSTPMPLQEAMNAFPLPTPNTPNLGNGLGEFVGTWSNPSSVDSSSVRLDHAFGGRSRLFFRFSDTSSFADVRSGGGSRSPSNPASSSFTIHTYTIGLTSSFSTTVSNEFRLNYSSNQGMFSTKLDSFGGADSASLLALQGLSSNVTPSPYVAVGLFFGSYFPVISQGLNAGQQKQWNTLDTLGLAIGQHELKMGIDYRRLDPRVYQNSPVVLYYFTTAASVQANSVDIGVANSFAPALPVYENFSAFVQDEWKKTSRLTVSMGLRWDVNPAPGAAQGNLPYTVAGNNLSTLALAPQGTPLWHTSWFNFAPRLGVSYLMRQIPARETVVRGGAGVFFDTGQQLGSYGYDGPGFSAQQFFGGYFGSPASFPLPASGVTPTIINPPVAPYTSSQVYAFPSHMQLPYTLQWNASIQQALGKSQALTASYIGSAGKRLLQESEVNVAPFNPEFGTVFFIRTGLTSRYDSLQVQFQRRLTSGLNALASYTWSHCLDYGSENFSFPYQHGNCDFDVRDNVSSALSYGFQKSFREPLARALLQNWGVDDRFTIRTSFPVTLPGTPIVDRATGQTTYSGLNLVAGEPVYIRGAECAAVYSNGLGCPGGRAVNPQAFAIPPSGVAGSAPRNFVRGFGAWQMDIALRRDFPIYERFKLQFRAETFNIFNHPNFGAINSNYCSPGLGCTFGQATATLASSLGGLSPLYQMGGPRSMQFALKLVF
jgi:Carboxypeptidase regulatory-like domain/TonB-dependent Receptor Plug Domain